MNEPHSAPLEITSRPPGSFASFLRVKRGAIVLFFLFSSLFSYFSHLLFAPPFLPFFYFDPFLTCIPFFSFCPIHSSLPLSLLTVLMTRPSMTLPRTSLVSSSSGSCARYPTRRPGDG